MANEKASWTIIEKNSVSMTSLLWIGKWAAKIIIATGALAKMKEAAAKTATPLDDMAVNALIGIIERLAADC